MESKRPRDLPEYRDIAVVIDNACQDRVFLRILRERSDEIVNIANPAIHRRLEWEAQNEAAVRDGRASKAPPDDPLHPSVDQLRRMSADDQLVVSSAHLVAVHDDVLEYCRLMDPGRAIGQVLGDTVCIDVLTEMLGVVKQASDRERAKTTERTPALEAMLKVLRRSEKPLTYPELADALRTTEGAAKQRVSEFRRLHGKSSIVIEGRPSQLRLGQVP